MLRKLSTAFMMAAMLSSCGRAERPQELHPVIAQGEHPYAYYALSHRERVLYDTVASALMYHRDRIKTDSSQGFTYDEIYGIYQLIYTDEYRIFFASPRFGYDADSGTMTFSYTCTREEQTAMQKRLDTAADRILCQTEGLDSYRTALAIHDGIIAACRYGEGGYGNTAYGCLVEGSAMCRGYTAAFSYLCSRAGIRTASVRDRDDTHIWSMAYLDGKWYHIDVTWDDPDDVAHPSYAKYDRFCLDDTGQEITQDIPDAAKGRSYFEEYGLIADSTDSAERIIKRSDAEVIQFRAEDKGVYEDIKKALFGDTPRLRDILTDKDGFDGVGYSCDPDTLVIRIFT